MLNVGKSSPLNLHRKALQAKLHPSATNSSHSMMGRRSFYSSSRSLTSDDRGATDLEGGNNHHPHPILQNPSLMSLRTDDASPSRDSHDHDQDPPTVLNIRLASGGVYHSERGRSREHSGRRITKSYVDVASDSEDGDSRSSAPSHPVCNRTFRLGDPSLNAAPDICFTVSFAVVIENPARGHYKGAHHDHPELGGRVAYPQKCVPYPHIVSPYQLGVVLS